MFYKKNSAPSLSDELFKRPTSEYRGTPFWAWNSHLEADELSRQIDIFKEMGLGGFHMHVRTGLSNAYLSDEFMGLVRHCVDKAKKEDMLAYLYDEDRWPSGAAGGLVTKDEQYRARCLLMTAEPCSLDEAETADVIDSRAEGGRNGKGYLIACYDVRLDSDGYLADYKRIGENDDAEGVKWYAYLKIHSPSPWYNNQTYVNTLDKKAIERFIEVTHERYAETVGDEFGGTVPSIFTDEPQFTRKQTLRNAEDRDDVILPWTDDLPQTFEAAYGFSIVDKLPELFWDLPEGRISTARYYYHDHISERFAEAFADTCGAWCRKHGISLTGHMMEEPTLTSQTAALGDCMRSYRGFDIPGIDMLCDAFEFTTAKQCQSAVRQYGREGMLSELYGVTGWDCDFRNYKLHGDWQACMGVTVRVPHLSWYAMGGEAKRDYPASVHYQSPWYKEFPRIEDHFARVNTAMTRGKPVVRVGVIHPVESFWLHWGPNDKSSLMRKCLDEKFRQLTEWLLNGSIDFDFICESLLPSQCEKGGAPLKVGMESYDAVIVPDCESLRGTTLDRLERFADEGGSLIFMGAAPTVSDGVPSERGKALYGRSRVIPFDREKLLTALEPQRDLTLRFANGDLSEGFIYQLRLDGESRWLFISRCREPYNKSVVEKNYLRITIKGEFSPMLYDTATGDISELDCEYRNGCTVISRVLYDYDSLLLRLDNGRRQGKSATKPASLPEKEIRLPAFVPYTLSERNALLLDTAEFSLDGAPFKPEEEILRLDNICRRSLGFPERGNSVAQPWVIHEAAPEHTLRLRFTIRSEIDFSGAELALEDAESAAITFNGEKVANNITGWYTDRDIKTVALPDIKAGENILEIVYPFGRRTNTEWCYLLGDFGVRVTGRSKVITALPDKLAFDKLETQGLPFYGGNVTYHLEVEANGALSVTATNYYGALIGVSVDGADNGRIIYPPYTLLAEDIGSGTHKVDITLYGHRFNAFGAVHLTDNRHSWHGPDAWRSEGCRWSYEYTLRPVGIIASPVIKVK